ncbi:MAG TPA: alanine--tRNA ligase [Crenotrichaceae bacterium]|nr:alanine--tRNA ligase [Crenotrichaceae bacterium]
MTCAELRSSFLGFFEKQGHTLVTSSSLVPAADPTLLFTNAGMVQFKDVFLGHEKRSYSRATSSQRCVRAGGKHNDLENVGYTARHHTFFEMLGNFSFGDYFKEDAIRYAWTFLTEELGIPQQRLWVTVFEDDQQAEDIWLNQLKVSPERFSRLGAESNFWSMGDIGPCGPCTEIFYDHGETIDGGPPGSPNEDGDRYVEIWNLVFMQYDRNKTGELTDLPHPSVDTGAGLERMAAVMQGVHSNYQIDLFQGLVKSVAGIAGIDDLSHSSLNVIADHIRSCAFLICDGVLPSNEGRGYVLRRIIRRAVRHGYQLGIHDVFFFKLVNPLCEVMGDAYPELIKSKQHIEDALIQEEQRFAETLEQGMKILDDSVATLTTTVIPGDVVFKLYDTYGFPVDLTADYAREHQLSVDMDGFESAMAQQRSRARAAGSFDADYAQQITFDGNTEFVGYEHTECHTTISAMFVDGVIVEQIKKGDKAIVVLETTPFYAESGGQVGDSGQIIDGDAMFRVDDTRKQTNGVIMHYGEMIAGELHQGSPCQATIDQTRRKAIALNHSATHLLHAALRQVLGAHVSQKGSLVNAERLRFDFSHNQPVNPAQIQEVERIVNQQIRHNNEVNTEQMDKADALKAGAMALFGEKYGDSVRVLRIGDFSTELCGGTHARRAGDIGVFKIVSETGIASGVRRIEAVSGAAAVERIEQTETMLDMIAGRFKSDRQQLTERVDAMLERNRHLEKELLELKSKIANHSGNTLAEQAVDINGVKVLATKLDNVEPKAVREIVDQLKNKLGSTAIVLATVNGNNISLVAGVSKDQTHHIKAGELVNSVAAQVGGKGGGRPDMAQAGGNNPAALDNALASVTAWVEAKLK